MGGNEKKDDMPLSVAQSIMPTNVVRRIWLNYYNDYLSDHNAISQDEWRKMRLIIERT